MGISFDIMTGDYVDAENKFFSMLDEKKDEYVGVVNDHIQTNLNTCESEEE